MRAILMMLALAVALAACGVRNDPELPPGTPKPGKPPDTTKTIIAKPGDTPD
ncbi:lipoprotein [Aestuariivirga sp.]|uniref:lipoprotein n=1 Tax=Aestuariivirga sp. TaxID=2650926 RepID=UPI0039E6A6A8